MNDEPMYTTRQAMDMLGVKSRQTMYARGWTDRAVRMFEDDTAPLMWHDTAPLMWPQSLVEELAKEIGVTL